MGNIQTGMELEQPLEADMFALTLKYPCRVLVINGALNIVEILRQHFTDINVHITKEKYRPDTGTFEFRLEGRPFARSSFNTDNMSFKDGFCKLLSALFKAGYEPVVSSDLSRQFSNSSVFFKKRSPSPKNSGETDTFACIAPSSHDKLYLIHTPDTPKLLQCIEQNWTLQDSSEEGPGIHKVKMSGYPWNRASGEEASKLRLMFLELIKIMRSHNYFLKINVNVKGTSDCLFFQRDYSLDSRPEDIFIMYMSKNDRLRLLNSPNYVVDTTRDVIGKHWSQGLQNERDHFGAREFKLKGHPWWAEGEEAVDSRFLVSSILHALRGKGWEVLGALDLSRRIDDKSIFVFKQGPPLNSQWACISFHELGKVRLMTSTESANVVLDEVINKHLGKVSVRIREYGKSKEWKIEGCPFRGLATRNVSQEYFQYLLTGILLDLKGFGWILDASTDISSKYIAHENDRYPMDVHSLFFYKVVEDKKVIRQDSGFEPSAPSKDIYYPTSLYPSFR